MSNRLQVILSDKELREFKKAAALEHRTLSDWVRGVLRRAARQRPTRDGRKKLEVVRAALEHEFPTAEVNQMNEEISRGYTANRAP